MLHDDRPVRDRHPRHLQAIEQSLGWADQAADSGDHDDALQWLQMVETLGHELPDEYAAKRESWRRASSSTPAQG